MNRSSLQLDEIRRVYGGSTAVPHPLIPNQPCAAVAMIFWPSDDALRLCFGLRATFDGDPWSGDMAFPGGKAEAQDKTFHDVAARETWEEIGLRLGREQLIGTMMPLQTFGNEKRPSLTIRPMMYVLHEPPPPFTISYELAAAYWISMRHLWASENWVERYVEWRGRHFPGIQFGEQVIWGLTLRILSMFGEGLGLPLLSEEVKN